MKKIAYAGLGFVATGVAIAIVVTQHASWWPFVVFAMAPDLALLYGMSNPHRRFAPPPHMVGRPGLARGQLHPRAVPFYNAVHRYWAPGLLVVLTYLLHSPAWMAAGLAWTAHISFDRSLGFGLRTREGFQRT